MRSCRSGQSLKRGGRPPKKWRPRSTQRLLAGPARVGNFTSAAFTRPAGSPYKRALCCPDSSPMRSKQREESRMGSFVNPLKRDGSSDLPEKTAAIRLWTRQNLPLTEESAVTVSEFACAKPSCPNRQTVILVLSEDAPTKKMSIHKTIADVSEIDVFNACLELLRAWPS